MDSKDIAILVGLCIDALIIAFIVYEYKKGGANGEKRLNNFLNSIKDAMVKVISDQISSFDLSVFNSKTSMVDFEKSFLKSIYEACTAVVTKELDGIKSTQPLTYAIIKKTITEDKINDYVSTLMSEENVQTKVANLYNIALSVQYQHIAKDDAELEKEQDKFDNGTDGSKESDTEGVVTNIDPDRGIVEDEAINPPTEQSTYVVDKDIDEPVTKEEYDSYQAIANKGIIDTDKDYSKEE